MFYFQSHKGKCITYQAITIVTMVSLKHDFISILNEITSGEFEVTPLVDSNCNR